MQPKTTSKKNAPDAQIKDRKIIYISGSGRSGSTVFDIVLGNMDGQFSLGELNFLPTNGMLNEEYCSCGARVPDCEFWSAVIRQWNDTRELSLEEYIRLQHKYIRNKATAALLSDYFFPGEDFKKFVRDTRRLYDILFDLTGESVLIDSSKNPQRILLLRKAGLNIEVFHLTRKFSGVLNSKKKELIKDEKAGIERTFKPSRSSYVFSTWSVDNFLTALFSTGMVRKRVKYENLIKNLTGSMQALGYANEEFLKKLEARGPFSPGHLVAGGRIRMKPRLMVEQKLEGSDLKNLNAGQRFFARVVDFFYG